MNWFLGTNSAPLKVFGVSPTEICSTEAVLFREEDALAEAEMSPEMYAQQQRLMALAKGHAAEMMERMKDLSPEQQKAFVAQQVRSRL